MNLIVSDFDGTLYSDKYDENINLVEKIRKNNIFVIATGRSISSLKKDLKIKCDYYICNDGSYILDKDENILTQNIINSNTVKTIYSRIIDLNYKEYYFQNINSYSSKIKEDTNKIFIKIDTTRNTDSDLEYILNNLNDVYAYKSQNWINIMSIKSTKENAIEYLSKNNDFNNIYVVGNDINDYGMIKKYNGYLITENNYRKYNCISSFQDLRKIINND